MQHKMISSPGRVIIHYNPARYYSNIVQAQFRQSIVVVYYRIKVLVFYTWGWFALFPNLYIGSKSSSRQLSSSCLRMTLVRIYSLYRIKKLISAAAHFLFKNDPGSNLWNRKINILLMINYFNNIMTTSHSQNTWIIVSGYFSQKQQFGESFLLTLVYRLRVFFFSGPLKRLSLVLRRWVATTPLIVSCYTVKTFVYCA